MARLGIVVAWLDEVADVEVRLDEVADVLLLHLWWGGHRRSRLLRLRLCCGGVDLGVEWLYERAAEWVWVAEWIWAAKWLYERMAEWI